MQGQSSMIFQVWFNKIVYFKLTWAIFWARAVIYCWIKYCGTVFDAYLLFTFFKAFIKFSLLLLSTFLVIFIQTDILARLREILQNGTVEFLAGTSSLVKIFNFLCKIYSFKTFTIFLTRALLDVLFVSFVAENTLFRSVAVIQTGLLFFVHQWKALKLRFKHI